MQPDEAGPTDRPASGRAGSPSPTDAVAAPAGRAGLTRRWARTLGLVAGTGPAVDAAGREVLARYAEARRAFHTVEHLGEVVAALDWVCGADGVPPAVELAGWLHDVVYDPRAAPGRNEEASAVYAGETLGRMGVPAALVAEVARLIRTTATHVVDASDAGGAVLADADLWILGSPPARYRRYADAVRREFGFLSDADWGAGRSAVIGGFAARNRIYVTDRAHVALDAAARRNLAWELATLGGGEAQP